LLLALSAPAVAVAAPRPKSEAKSDDLARARTLDKSGARAYAEGRYAEAIKDFEEAYRLGGPAFELWNVAKCYLRLDQPDQAASMLERYLALSNLPKEDRDEAAAQLDALKKRPSPLTVTSTPPGASVAIDGKMADGKTPLTTSVAPGNHTVSVSAVGMAPISRQIEAKYGRAVVVDAAAPPPEERPPPPPNPYETPREPPPLALRAALGVAFTRHGSVGGDPGVLFDALATYRLGDIGERVAFSVGALLSIAHDSWGNQANDPNPPNCVNVLHDPQSATAVSVFGVGEGSLEIVRSLRGSAFGGVGLGGLFTSDVGGDVFIPSCTTTPGARPMVLLGFEFDYALTPSVRLSLLPITMQVQPAFAGTRATPRDASSPWMRFGIAFGAGVDL
jgi:hypothetical protein